VGEYEGCYGGSSRFKRRAETRSGTGGGVGMRWQSYKKSILWGVISKCSHNFTPDINLKNRHSVSQPLISCKYFHEKRENFIIFNVRSTGRSHLPLICMFPNRLTDIIEHLGDLDANGRIILMWIWRSRIWCYGLDSCVSGWGSNHEPLWTRQWAFGFHKRTVISWLACWLPASHSALRSMEADSLSSRQEIPDLLGIQVHRNQLLDPTLNLLNPVYTLEPVFLRYIFILSSHPCWSLPSGHFPSDFPTRFYIISCISEVNVGPRLACLIPCNLSTLIIFGEAAGDRNVCTHKEFSCWDTREGDIRLVLSICEFISLKFTVYIVRSSLQNILNM
jgi:hypothetical protein